jgi:hypothetical protein
MVMRTHFIGSLNLVCSELKVSGLTQNVVDTENQMMINRLISQPNYAYLFLQTHVLCGSLPEIRKFPVIGNFPKYALIRISTP